MILPIPAVTIHVTTLAVNAAKKMLIADHSDLGNYIWQRLYDDAIDVGIALYNPSTGATTRWSLTEEVRDKEGELSVTLFSPTPETFRMVPAMRGWVLHVLND